VISNLLSNARHHGELGREILVDLFSDNEKICLQVKNFGIPIDDDLVPSLFSPFKQHSLQNKRNKGGLGLGLYIAHSIAASHGGSIVYEYQSPHIVFKMWLPKSISFAVTGA
jgi:signal transduction histidine kinase